MTWASVSFDHKCPSEGEFLLWYSEYMSEPVIYYFTGVKMLSGPSLLLSDEWKEIFSPPESETSTSAALTFTKLSSFAPISVMKVFTGSFVLKSFTVWFIEHFIPTSCKEERKYLVLYLPIMQGHILSNVSSSHVSLIHSFRVWNRTHPECFFL